MQVLCSLTRSLTLDSALRLPSCSYSLLAGAGGSSLLPSSCSFLLPSIQTALGVQEVRHSHNSIRLVAGYIRIVLNKYFSDLRKGFNWKRERPVGPNKHKPPNLCGSRASLNYRHIVSQ